MVGAVLFHLAPNGGCNHVARLQLVGKALARLVKEHGAFAAAALGNQEGATGLRRGQARWVDLHVIEVLARNAMLSCDIARIARELRIISRMIVYAADTAAGPQRMRRADVEGSGRPIGRLAQCPAQFVSRVERGLLRHRNGHDTRAGVHAIARFEQDVDHRHVLENLHVGKAAHRIQQLSGNFLARDVGVEGNARATVRALARKIKATVRLALKVNAERQQVIDHSTAGTNHDVDALAAVLVVPRTQRVGKKRLVIITLGQHADAALCEHGVALVNASLGKHHDLRILGQIERRIEAGHAAAGNHHVACHILDVRACHIHRFHRICPLASCVVEHTVERELCLLGCLGRNANVHFARACLKAANEFLKRNHIHVHAGRTRCREEELLACILAAALQLIQHAGNGHDDELAGVGLLGKLDDAGRGANVVGLGKNIGLALGMRQDKRLGVRVLNIDNLLERDDVMARAVALVENHVLFRHLFGNIASQVLIRDKQHMLLRQLAYDLRGV